MKTIDQLSQRKEKQSRKVWLTLKEFSRFSYLVTWIFEMEEQKKATSEFFNRVKTLWIKSGSNFTFLYLKECNRLIIKFLSGSPEVVAAKSGIYVRRDSFGIPSILPIELRSYLMNKGNVGVKFILTVISIYRVFPTVQRAKLSTILDPFSGISRCIDFALLKRAKKDLRLYAVPKFNHKLINLESASPMATKSSWGSNLDLVALWHHPRQLLLVIIGLTSTVTGWFILLWIIPLLILAIIPALVSFIFWGILPVGRLSVVKDQAGKGRVVAITNYWIQLSLYPLHKSIFQLLSRIKMDGTFDQRKPLLDLISRVREGDLSGHQFSCFDLSAATDRLPIDVQKQVLSIVYNNWVSFFWSEILNFAWLYRNIRIKYSVGQPMGAYSSFAMLALTHHFIVKCAAIKARVFNFEDYCILGDDIVIYNNAVAVEYQLLMKSLGLSINPNKSVLSNDFAEFAKVLIGPNCNYSPLGAGIILRTIRDKGYFGALIAECFKQDVLSEYSALLRLLGKLKGYKTQKYLALWSVFGLNGAVTKGSIEDSRVLTRAITIMWPSARTDAFKLPYYVLNAVRQVRLNMLAENVRNLTKELSYFNRHWYSTFVLSNVIGCKSSIVRWSLWIFESISKILSPSFWVLWFRFGKNIISLLNLYFFLNWSEFNSKWETILSLISDKSLDMASIDWRDKKEVRRVSRYALLIRAYSLIYKAHYEIDINDHFSDWAFTLLIKRGDIDSLNKSLIYWGSEPLKPITFSP